MSCDINFKSQEHLKNLGTAVEIMSVYTDLHMQTHRVSTKFPGTCLQLELWFKYCVKKVSCWQKWNSNWCNFLRWHMFSILIGNIPHETYTAAVISRCPRPAVKLHYKIYNPLGFNAYWHNPYHCENYIVMTALQCIISRWSLNLMSSVQDATCGVNL